MDQIFQERSGLERIKTGIQGLDELISGGLPKKSITLVSGPPGGGKSIFCFQFLYEGIKNGEKCLFLTLDKQVEGLLIQAKQLGFDFQSAIEKKLAKFQFLNINKKHVYEAMKTTEPLARALKRMARDNLSNLKPHPQYVRFHYSHPPLVERIEYLRAVTGGSE